MVLASRWRFTYFEKWEDTVNRIFGEQVPIGQFADGCKQLLYNIEWIEHEAAEYGANDQNALVDAFGPMQRARVERFFSDWEVAKKSLLSNFPSLNTEVTEANRGEIRARVIEFLQTTRSQNAEFLELAVKAYSDEVKASLVGDRSDRDVLLYQPR